MEDGKMANTGAMPEPYKIKVVEPIRLNSHDDRKRILEAAGHNLFMIPAEEVFIDLLTDSGTSAMSIHQWAGVMLGDESYAGSRSYFKFENAIKDIMGFKYVLPTHQGRGGDKILFDIFARPGKAIPSNMHFDSSRGHTEAHGSRAVDLVIDEAYDPRDLHPFKGNMDLDKLESFIKESGVQNIPMILMTVHNNVGGGQPVSMENIRGTKEIASKYGIPFFIDAARFAENAYFIKEREHGYEDKPIPEIVKEMMSYFDGCTMSAKKDGLANIGGFLAMNDYDLWLRCAPRLVGNEGFIHYGGMSGRDMEAVARGLYEVMDEAYLANRIRQVRYLGERLIEAGIEVIQPTGGHGVFVDAKAFLPHVPQEQFTADALAAAVYQECAVRGAALGTLWAERDPVTGENRPPKLELYRLAVPRRVYTDRHMDYVAQGMREVFENREKVRGLEIVYEPRGARSFLARLKPVGQA
jgi:tryptophanase